MLNKLLSGRFLMCVVFTITACIGFLREMIPSEIFVPIVVLIANSYFNRNDRKNNGENGGIKP